MPLVAEIIYILCALTSLTCAILLLRGYRRSKARILLWSTLCFFFLAANNILLFLDLIIFTHIDLSFYRDLANLLAVLVLVGGLVLDSE